MNEFDLIHTYFQSQFTELTSKSKGIALGIGDDCAILTESGLETVVSTDTLVAGRHFPEHCPARVVAARSFGAASSDLAAMGAAPLGYTMALSLPAHNEEWLSEYAAVLLRCSEKWQLPLIGGDTVCGPLMVTMTVFGRVERGQALLRKSAVSGEDIWVSGSLGDAAGGLEVISGNIKTEHTTENLQYLINRYESPEPRLKLGQFLSGLASSAIDISDGLLADLGHILKSSALGAVINAEDIPLSHELIAVLGQDKALLAALTGGDDYELCFTASPGVRSHIQDYAQGQHLGLARIGVTTSVKCIRVMHKGMQMNIDRHGFDHFG